MKPFHALRQLTVAAALLVITVANADSNPYWSEQSELTFAGWADDHADETAGFAVRQSMDAYATDTAGAGLRWNIEAGDQSSTDTLTAAADWGLGFIGRLGARSTVYVGPSLNYVRVDRSRYGAAANMELRTHFARTLDAVATIRRDWNALTDPVSAEVMARLWVKPTVGVHLSTRHHFDSEVNQHFVGLIIRRRGFPWI